MTDHLRVAKREGKENAAAEEPTPIYDEAVSRANGKGASSEQADDANDSGRHRT